MSSALRCSQAAYADCRVKAPCFRKCQDKAKVLKNQHAAESAVEALQRKMQAQQEDMERKIIRLKSLRNIQDDHRVLDSYRTFVPRSERTRRAISLTNYHTPAPQTTAPRASEPLATAPQGPQ